VRGGQGTAPNVIDRDFRPYSESDLVEIR